MSRFDGRVAIVTGAAQGIGAATARLLAAQGATVVVINGLSGQAWAKADKAAGKPASVTVSIANGQATVAAAQAKFSFAARRR